MHRTFCRICIAACGLQVTTDGDQVLEVKGDLDHPLSAGYTCSKGRALRRRTTTSAGCATVSYVATVC